MYKVAFTEGDDALLMKYIATYNPQRRGRLGTKLYEKLVENAERKWSFSSRHSVQSWRERYKQNQPRFDAQILRYQKKHGISVDASDNISSQTTLQGSSTKTPPATSGLPHSNPSRSGASVGESGAKKRLRELDSENNHIDSGVAKRRRREKVSVKRRQLSDSPSHTRSLPQNGEEARAESSLLSRPTEDMAAPAIGPNDYTGALSGSGESDEEGERQSEEKVVNAPDRSFSSPNKAEMKPSVALRKSPTPTLVGTTTKLPPSHHRSSPAVIAEAPGLVRESEVAPAQPSQEPTPPHTSAISSPRSPLLRQPSPDPSQPEISPGRIPSASLKQRRILSSPHKRTIVSGEDDDIFSTPPPQTIPLNLPRGTRGKQVPRLLEGPFRSVYATANGESQRESGMDESAEVVSKGEEWPPLREKRKGPISEGQNTGNSISLQEREQPHPPSSALSTSNAVPANESRPTATKAVPLQVAQVTTSAVAKTSKGSRGPLQSNARLSLSNNQLPNSERNPGSIRPKVPALVANSNRLLFPAVSAHELPPPVPAPSKRASLGQYPNPATRDDVSIGGDPFIVPPANRETRRRTLGASGGFSQANARKDEPIRRASVQHIDLRKLHSSKGLRTSLAGSTASLGRSNSSDSSSMLKKKLPRRSRRSSIQPNLSESNKELVLVLGLEAVYSRMAENHKFHIDVVREVASRQRSLEDADRMLRNMREAAGREYARMLRQEYEAEESEEEDGEDAAKPGIEEDDDHAVRPTQVPLRSNPSPPSSLPQGRPRRLALKITTESPDSSPMRPPHYSPPTPTRAHEFRRLERQGRVEEARLREARRVRRSLQPNSAEASPEVGEHKVTAYLLQLREADADDVLPEKPWNVSISPGLEEGHVDKDSGQFQGDGIVEDDGAQVGAAFLGGDPDDDDGVDDGGNNPSNLLDLGQDFINEDGLGEDAALMDSKLHQISGLGDEDAETAEVEEQLDANVGHRALSHLQATGPEDDSPVADNAGSAADERQTLQEEVLAKGARHNEYGVNAASSMAWSALGSLSLLDAAWTNSDDELLLDGDLDAHRELVKRKGLCSVKFRTAHLYSLLLDG